MSDGGNEWSSLPDTAINTKDGGSTFCKCTTRLSPLHYAHTYISVICQSLWGDKLLFILLSDCWDSSSFGFIFFFFSHITIFKTLFIIICWLHFIFHKLQYLKPYSTLSKITGAIVEWNLFQPLCVLYTLDIEIMAKIFLQTTFWNKKKMLQSPFSFYLFM